MCSNSNISDFLINSHDDAGCINMRTKRLATCLHVHVGNHDGNHGSEYVHDETMMTNMMVKVWPP